MGEIMTLEQIKDFVNNGQEVYWSSKAYIVINDKLGQWFIKCLANNHCIGLTDMAGNLSGKENNFFIGESKC